jgi:hypothetical protein
VRRRGHGRGCDGQERERIEVPLGIPGVTDAEVHVGTSNSAVPLGPTVPSGAPSATESFCCTTIEPRCVRLTASPAAVWIVTVLPFAATVPAKLTTPAAGASTGAPASAPIAMPRCWPAAYGCAWSNEKVWSTGPRTGHVQALAHGTKSTSRRTAGASRRIRITALLSGLQTSRESTVAAAPAVVNLDYSVPR